MSFDALETSIENGRPIYLYRFILNDKTWYYTSADHDIEALGQTWIAVPIADDGTKLTGEAVTDALSITASTEIEPAKIYMHYPPSRPIQVAILRLNDGNSDSKTVYMGEITQVNVATPGTATITCETLSATMNRDGLRLGWQRSCPYALYDPLTCRVDKWAWAIPAVIDDIIEDQVICSALAGQDDHRFAGGFIEWTDPVRGVERRALENSNSLGTIVIFGTTDGLEVGMNITVFPGCTRTTASCNKFNNMLNYGGIPALQGKSPFDGDPIFY